AERDNSGQVERIDSIVLPLASLLSTVATGTRVPLNVTWPWQTRGSTTKNFPSSCMGICVSLAKVSDRPDRRSAQVIVCALYRNLSRGSSSTAGSPQPVFLELAIERALADAEDF